MVHRLRCSAPLKRTRTWPPTVRLRRKRASKGSAEAPCARSPSSLESTYSTRTAESSQMNCEIHDSLHILYSADINSDPKVSRHQCLNELDGIRSRRASPEGLIWASAGASALPKTGCEGFIWLERNGGDQGPPPQQLSNSQLEFVRSLEICSVLDNTRPPTSLLVCAGLI